MTERKPRDKKRQEQNLKQIELRTLNNVRPSENIKNYLNPGTCPNSAMNVRSDIPRITIATPRTAPIPATGYRNKEIKYQLLLSSVFFFLFFSCSVYGSR